MLISVDLIADLAVGIFMSISVLRRLNRTAPNRGAPMKRGGSQGRRPALAGTPGFSNFFGHFGPLARPMEGCVDFYHTNFSRRSHPCRPELLPLSRMSKRYPFDFNLGPTLGQLWADFGLTLDQLLADFGPTLSRLWADFRPTSANFGATLGQRWADFRSTLGQLLNLAGSVTFISGCLLYTSPSPRDKRQSRMPSSA